jgi:starch phosphorylase
MTLSALETPAAAARVSTPASRLDTFQVVPVPPARIAGLTDLAFNLLWTWDDEVRAIFPRVDRVLWEESYQNPVLMLGRVAQARLAELAQDDSFLAFYDRTWERFQSYLREPTWWGKRYAERPLIAYFCAEYGLAECLPIYSGGLGVLAAHHLKSASDLGVPLVGVGLLYQKGYFRQYLSADGWQQESYPVNDFYNLPVRLVTCPDGTPRRVELRLDGRRLVLQVWRAEVGRLVLYLLDANVPENPPDLQVVTDQLYGGDHEHRLRQEIVLGIGGLRALHALGLRPAVCHMNEGHSALLSLERIRVAMREHGVPFEAALQATRAGNIFTTHTPVPAGFDVFTPGLIERYLGDDLRPPGVSRRDLLALGRANPDDDGEGFNMAVLALRTSASTNGVSRLHGEVSRRLLERYAPGLPRDEVPVEHVTNGAHTWSAVSREMAGLFDRYLGPDWWRRPGQSATWEGVDSIPDEELWATHERRRERLVAFVRSRLMRQLEQRGASHFDLERARGVLDTRALTIGFARRFATYKRAGLILSDPARFKRLLLDPARPVQIVFGGKAHPRDAEAKEMLKAVVAFCQQEDVRRHAVFVEDYDLVVARYLVQGVDVWLNTPRRGLEASGTSGMKVVPNGGLNLSIPDGWWAEAGGPEVGWTIGRGEEYADHAYQDQVESGALYELLEKDVVPLFYQRGPDGLPRVWISRMKKSMRRLAPAYSSNRMIWEYVERFYLPAARHHDALAAAGCARASALSEWIASIRQRWGDVAVERVEAGRDGPRRVGDGFEVTADVRLGQVAPGEVAVEIYYGPLDAQRSISTPFRAPMSLDDEVSPGVHRFRGVIPCERTGLQGYTIRVRPAHPDANNLLVTGLVTWR